MKKKRTKIKNDQNGVENTVIEIESSERENVNEVKTIQTDVKSSETKVLKAEETKAEETKAEETKTEETKAEETKAEETKAEETKAEETKAEETKVEETKVEETKVDETKINETKINETKIEETKDKETEKKSWLKIVVIVCSTLFVAALIGVYFYFADYYKDLFFPETFINEIDCSGMSAEQAEKLIEEKVEDYELAVTFRDGSDNVIEGKKIDYQYVSSGEVRQLLSEQDVWKWFLYLFSEKEYNVAEDIEYDEGLLQAEFYSLDNLAVATQTKPEDAYVTYQGVSFVIVPEVEGNLIRQAELFEEVKKAVSSSQRELDVAELDVYEAPEIRSNNAELLDERAQLNNLASVNITHTLADGDKVLDGNTVREWLTVDQKGNYSITEEELREKVTEYVSELSAEADTVGSERKFHATIQGDITVSGGSYGYRINKKEEINQIMEDITNHTVTTREPVYTRKEVSTEGEGFGDSYIEIDLSNQHLWYYIDGELYMESNLVSGTYVNASRRTPGGIYQLSYKQRNKVLRGQLQEDGTYDYECPVSYWMPFNGGIGLHDASWRGSFGGSIYKYSGSHGCINLPFNSAKMIYEKIDLETPIILYY